MGPKYTVPLILTVICLSAGIQKACAQTDTLRTPSDTLRTPTDTSYFQAGRDDWNLLEAVLRGNHANALMLLERGADPNARAEGGVTALMFAAEKGDLLMVKILVLNGADVDLTYVENTTPLIVAVLNGHFDVAHFLLRKGADPNHRDDLGGSPLIYAAALNHYRIADLLLFFGASDTIRDRRGNDPLMTAVFFKNIETADVLLQNGLGPDTRDRNENTPLMIAAQRGYPDILTMLLEYGAGIRKVNEKNHTPLAHAVAYGQEEAARILIDSGASVHHKITPALNLYDVAAIHNREKILKLLKEKGAAPVPRPDFSRILVAWGNSFRSDDYLMQTRVTWMDRKFGLYGETGFDFRPFQNKIQVRKAPGLIHQYRETRYVWTHGAGKYFNLFRDHTGIEYGVWAGVYGMLSFPRYRGTEDHPPAQYDLAPSAGIYLAGKMAGFKAGAERYHFGTLHEGPWKMNLTLFITFSTQPTDHAPKEIYY